MSDAPQTAAPADVNDLFDVTIIGAGPVGLFGAFYAGMRGMKVKMIDSLAELGGQLSALYPDKYIFDMAGFPKVLARDLVKDLSDQALQFHPTVCLEEKVMTLTKTSEGFALGTEKGVTHRTKTVLITAGVGAFAPKKLDKPEYARFEGHGLHYMIPNLSIFKGRRLLVVGGGDSAVEEATFLTKFATKVTIVHRRDALRASKIMQDRAHSNPKIDFIWDSTITEIKDPAQKKVTGVVLKNLKTGAVSERKCDGVFMAIGHTPNSEVFKGQIELDPKGYIKVHDGTFTSVEGVFACGDVQDFKYRQAVTAAGSGCMAALDAERWLEAHHEPVEAKKSW